MSNIEIMPYGRHLKKIWDDYVEGSKNGTFLFLRDYMDYHSDRFSDASLLVYRKDKLYCLFPANISGKTVYSHQGLTYGGLIMNYKCSAEGILEVFDAIKKYYKENGIKELIYKPVPYIYHTIPSQEDLYALFRNDAIIAARNISSTIDMQHRVKMAYNRMECVKKASKNGVEVFKTEKFEAFWEILETNLRQKYGEKPVHTLQEIKHLYRLFPDNILLAGAFSEGRMIGGILCYLTRQTIHTQYISATEEGKRKGAIDAIVYQIMENVEGDIEYFDFGTSNAEGGRILNEALIFQKEGFGARGVCYDTYKMKI